MLQVKANATSETALFGPMEHDQLGDMMPLTTKFDGHVSWFLLCLTGVQSYTPRVSKVTPLMFQKLTGNDKSVRSDFVLELHRKLHRKSQLGPQILQYHQPCKDERTVC